MWPWSMPLNSNDSELLRYMRSATIAAQSFVNDLTLQMYLASDLHASAVERKLIVIGEAAGELSSDLIRRYSRVRWDLITGVRHKLVHDYYEIDSRRIWQIVTEDLPDLLNNIDFIVASEA